MMNLIKLRPIASSQGPYTRTVDPEVASSFKTLGNGQVSWKWPGYSWTHPTLMACQLHVELVPYLAHAIYKSSTHWYYAIPLEYTKLFCCNTKQFYSGHL